MKPQDVRSYECKWRKNWHTIEAISPKEAARIFAEKLSLEEGDLVTIKDIGRYKISTNVTREAKKFDL